MFIAQRDIGNVPVADGEIAQNGIRAERIVFHTLNGGLGEAAVGGGVLRRDVAGRFFVVSLCEKRHVDIVKCVVTDDRINDAAPHKDPKFFFLDVAAVPAGYGVKRVSFDHGIFPVFHLDRTLDTVLEGAVQHVYVGVVFVRREAVGVDAAVKVIKTAVLYRDINIRRLVKFRVFSVKSVCHFVRSIQVDGTALSIFIVRKITV